MITIKTNISAVMASLAKKMNMLTDKEYLLRPLAVEMIPVMTERIHQKGMDSKGAQIGTYSEGYMKVRTGQYGNSAKVTRGANKGKTKDSGTTTRGANVGKARPKYNRSGDTRVVVSLTRQLENDWSVIATPKGYGIGFLNSHNSDKAGWVEETYTKKIFALTEQEREQAGARLTQLVHDAFD